MISPDIMMFLWPLVAIFLFSTLKPVPATAWTLVAGYLILPTQGTFDLPLLPQLSKDSVPAICALVGALLTQTKITGTPTGWIPRSPLVRGLIGLLLIGAMGTALTNGDRLVYGRTVIEGLSAYEGASLALRFIMMLVPFLIARKVFAHPDHQTTLISVVVIAMSAYAVLALYEVRMSPQLNRIVYGFFPHSWAQHVRDGGFRPVVFLRHGLELSILLCCSYLAALTLVRFGSPEKRGFFAIAAVWLLGTLILSKSLGALMIAIALTPVILFLNLRLNLLAAATLAAAVLVYPVLRSADMVPVDRILSVAERADEDRAYSFRARLINEEALLDKAFKRPVFGWGDFRRNRIFDERGRDLSTTDGRWVITIGQNGWVGYIAFFGLLSFGVISLAVSRGRIEPEPVTAAIAVVLAANLIDSIPNSGLTPITWLLAGALAGRLELARETNTAPSPETAGGQRQKPITSRMKPTQGPLAEATQRQPMNSTTEKPDRTRYTRFDHATNPTRSPTR